MKVISGILKGREIAGYNLENTRPTMDRVKESLFAIIQNNIKDAQVLDLFSGSGNLGIEALSNGASKCFFVDKNKDAYKVICHNIKLFDIVDRAVILNYDYKKALQTFICNNQSFDIIFLDPPYNTNYINDSLEVIRDSNILRDEGIIVCESDNLNKIDYDGYNICKEKKYGDKYIVILKKI